MSILLDSNVLIDLVLDSAWAGWVSGRMEEHAEEPFFVNQLVYAELSSAFTSATELDELFDGLGISRADLPWEAAWDAGRAFLRYRRAGGPKEAVLPDFYIGAHAASAGMTLMTRDARLYRTYFPQLPLIAP